MKNKWNVSFKNDLLTNYLTFLKESSFRTQFFLWRLFRANRFDFSWSLFLNRSRPLLIRCDSHTLGHRIAKNLKLLHSSSEHCSSSLSKAHWAMILIESLIGLSDWISQLNCSMHTHLFDSFRSDEIPWLALFIT